MLKRLFTYWRLKHEFKRTHRQVVTVHENMQGDQWVTIRWELK